MFHNRTVLSTLRAPFATVTGTGPDGIFGGNLIAWWDGESGLSGDTIVDLSGNGHTLTRTGVVLPIMGTLNGFPAWLFSAAGDASGCFSAGSPGSLSFPGLGSAGAVFTVMSVSSSAGSGTYGRIFSSAVGGPDNDNLNSWTAFLVIDSTALNTACNFFGTGSTSTYVADEIMVMCFAFDAGNIYTYKNNVQVGSTTSVGGTINIGGGAGGGSSSFKLGNDVFAPAYISCFVGLIGACFVVNQTPDLTHRTLAYEYLRDKFGL